jgi:eukaryotic-like serine/threonine-protein kinase
VLHAPHRRSHRRRLALALALAAIVVAAGGFTAYRLIGRTFPVPQTEGAMQNAAAATLRGKGFGVAFTRIYSDQQPGVGRVVRQSPRAGVKLAHSETVRLWVSRGPLHIPMPDLGGMSAAAAAAEVKRNGLVGSRLSGKSDEVATGMVFRQVPLAGRAVARGRAVAYWVSTGPTGVLVIDYTGQDAGEAVAALEAAGLHVEQHSSWGWGDSPGTVTKQDPAGGVRLPRGSTVSIWVAVF